MTLPEDFVWGTSTAAYQIEGGWNADGKKPSIWDVFSHTPGKILNGDNGDIACDHYNRLAEDLDIISGVAPNYRFSFSWPRILDENGHVLPRGADFYNRLIDGLAARGVIPWATVFHWDLPQYLQDRGGWQNRDSAGWLADFSLRLMDLFGDRVCNWMIFNEPNVHAWFGHCNGIHAPGIKGTDTYLRAAHNINRAIGCAYRAMKSARPRHTVGSTYQVVDIRPSTPGTSARAVQTMDAIWNANFLDPLFRGAYPEIMAGGFAPYIQDGDMDMIKTDLDFIGVQHYNPIYIADNDQWPFGVFFGDVPAGIPKTGYGWPILPGAFKDTLIEFHQRYNHPSLLITENGAAYLDEVDADGKCRDAWRIDYLNDHIGAVAGAMAAGVPVKGYFVWSLFDNFEWADGYKYRFGLVHVDYKTGKRTRKDSYDWYGTVARENKLTKAA